MRIHSTVRVTPNIAFIMRPSQEAALSVAPVRLSVCLFVRPSIPCLRFWIDVRQTKAKLISGPFYIYCQYISPVKMLRFGDICLYLSWRAACHSGRRAMRRYTCFTCGPSAVRGWF